MESNGAAAGVVVPAADVPAATRGCNADADADADAEGDAATRIPDGVACWANGAAAARALDDALRTSTHATQPEAAMSATARAAGGVAASSRNEGRRHMTQSGCVSVCERESECGCESVCKDKDNDGVPGASDGVAAAVATAAATRSRRPNTADEHADDAHADDAHADDEHAQPPCAVGARASKTSLPLLGTMSMQ